MPRTLVLVLLAACVCAEIVLAVRIAGARQRGDVPTIRRCSLLSAAILVVVAAHGIWVGDRVERLLAAVLGVTGIVTVVQVFRRWPTSRRR